MIKINKYGEAEKVKLFDGKMDNVKVYDRALTYAEIKSKAKSILPTLK